MVFEDVVTELQTLHLTEHGYLLFNPAGDLARLKKKFDDIVATTNRFWVKSKDAKYRGGISKDDAFASAYIQPISSR